MADTFTKEQRSRAMAAIKSKHTKPEMLVQKMLHAAGFRYRLHYKGLPGQPDLVFPRYKAVIFIHGCYWHYHGCTLSHLAKSNTDYWLPKIKRNLERDKQHVNALLESGWRVLIVWECAIRGKNKLEPATLLKRITAWLDSDKPTACIG